MQRRTMIQGLFALVGSLFVGKQIKAETETPLLSECPIHKQKKPDGLFLSSTYNNSLIFQWTENGVEQKHKYCGACFLGKITQIADSMQITKLK